MDRSHLRPPYPILQTPSSTSAFQSSTSSLSSVSSQSSTMSPTSSTRPMSAPLPSPTVSQPQQQYFNSMDASTMQQRMWVEQAAYQQRQAAPQAQQYTHRQAYQQQQYEQQYAQQQYAQQQYAQQQYVQQQHVQQQQQSGRVEGYQYQPDRSGAGATAQETAQYISDYGLVAEAARRAQMAVLMRDLEGVDLR